MTGQDAHGPVTSKPPRPGRSATARTPQLRRPPAALIALALGIALTAFLAVSRSNDMAAVDEQLEQSALDEFATDVEAIDRQLATELGRVSELMQGLVAYVNSSPDPAVQSVVRYLTVTGAESRFDALRGGSALDPAAAPTILGAGLTRSVQESVLGRPSEPFVAVHSLDGTDDTVLAFPLDDPAGVAEWAALRFDTTRFLVESVRPHAGVRVAFVATDAADTQDVPRIGTLTGRSIAVARPDGGLTASTDVGVLGSVYSLEIEAPAGTVERMGRTSVWVTVAIGLIMSTIVAYVLHQIGRSRAAAEADAQRADDLRQASIRRFRASFDRAPIGMAELDAAGRLVAANGALCSMLAADRDTVVGKELSAIVHPADRALHRARLASVVSGEVDAVQGDHRYMAADGRELWVSESVSVIDIDGDGTPSLLVQTQDVTAQRRSAWELMQRALHDELTGLPNRALLVNSLNNALVRSDRREGQVAVLFIDIDRFKVVNDSLGHDLGDALLIEVAARLGQAVREGDVVARFGGDEFVVLCEDVSGASEAVHIAQRIHSSIARPLELGGTTTFATASVGIALGDADETSAEALLRDADAAMYRAKQSGRNRSELFDTSMRTAMLAQLEIESQLRDALQNGQIVMHYQAIVDPHTHLATGYEALVRWNHPEKGLLGPGAFLPVAEEAGLIHLIDSFALATVCRQLAEWIERYPVARHLYVTTNWSARNLGRFVQEVEQVLQETRIPPRQLVIEVTEGFLLEDTESSMAALQRLKGLGVQVAIDDFGTGYSSLSYLTRLSVDFLKIDRSFIADLANEASAAVVGAIADMASRLGIGLVAEGVETDEQLAILQTLGAPRLQGYRFAKPRPASDIARQLAVRSGIDQTANDAGDARRPIPVGAVLARGALEA